ncbi:hypothetical protein RUM43_014551 [Polyplax serrata]|uniref:C2H2-type domain-containing protein n=1 Tax=Polyplax serrata TaxID=468196 RepID=A0AAN8S9I5_POLSC
MKNAMVRSTREEIKQKLLKVYSDSLDSGRNVLDFDKKYDFFSLNESAVLKYSSNWFRPEKYNSGVDSVQPSLKHFQTNYSDECSGQGVKSGSLLKVEKSLSQGNLNRDLEILGRTPYQIGVDGEKFRVVAATLQKCNSPFIRRTFHFTSNGIVEASSDKKEETDSSGIIPVLQQGKNALPQQKFVRIRRFRVIKKDELPLERYVLPQKIKITNGEKTRFLTVRIRSKNPNERVPSTVKLEGIARGETAIGSERGDVADVSFKTTANVTSAIQTDEDDGERTEGSEPDISVISMDATEDDRGDKVTSDVGQQLKKVNTSTEREGDLRETFNCENCLKQFPTYVTCLAHVRTHQKQICQFCAKRFLTAKVLREHIRMQHQNEVARRPTAPEDRITTATSKFGRTRQVLNVAGLRSKYRML